jgi:hypothetical protein
MAKGKDSAGLHHGAHGSDFGASKATESEPYPKVAGANKPLGGHAGSHDGVCREHGSEGKKSK